MGSVEPPKKPIHIAIIGGGIGGAIRGVGLSSLPQTHVTYTIYESRSRFGEIGAGLGFGANSHRAMSAIHPSVWEGYQKIASFNGWPEKQKVWFEFSVGDKVNGNEGVKIAEVEMADGQTQSTCHRAHFLDVLVKLLPEGCAEFDKRLVGVDEKEVGDNKKLVIRFADGTTAEADAVVGCDGIRSATRSVVFGANSPLSKPQFTGKVAYRGLTPMAKAVAVLGNDKAENRQMYLGHQGHVLTFGVARGTLLNVVAFHTAKNKDKWEGEWIQPLQKDSLDRDFVGWGQQVTKLMDLIQAPDVWAIFDHPPVPSFHKGNIALLGDAAHATSPHYGQGAGMAIEDAYILSNLFAKCTSPSSLPAAFTAYDHVRVPRALRVTEMSREQGRLLDMEADNIGDDLEKIREALESRVRWIWDIDLENHLREAITKFENENVESHRN